MEIRMNYFYPSCKKELRAVPDWLNTRRTDREELSEYEVFFEYTDPDRRIWRTIYKCSGCGAEGEI